MSNRTLLESRKMLSSLQSNSEDPLAPLIVMSGHVVKRTRGFAAKWQKRYWQLLGDGALIYFSGDHRLKVLGEIDIAHTCYEVRHGSENCEVKFPPAVPPNCCFSVAVLKRTYYFYTFSGEEAEKWVEALKSSSYLINRLRPRRLNCNPAVQVAIKALHEMTPPVPPSTQPPPSRYKPPPPPPSGEERSKSVGESSSEENDDGPSELPNFNKLSHGGRKNMSVPDLRFDSSGSNITHNGSWIDGSPRIRSSSILTTTPPSPLTHSATGHQSAQQRRRAKTVSYSPQFSDIETPTHTHKNTAVLKQRYMSQGNLLEGNDLESSNTLPSPAKLARMKQKWKSAYDVQLSPAFERLEELQQQENAIKKRIEEMRKIETFSYLSHHGIPVIPPPSPIESTSMSQQSFHEKLEAPPISPGYHSQPNANEFTFPGESKIVSNEKLPKRAPKVSPKPSGRRPTPATLFANSVSPTMKSSNEQNHKRSNTILEESLENISILEEVDEGQTAEIMMAPNEQHKSSSRRTSKTTPETNVWVKNELTKLINEIQMIGYQTSNGQIEVKFGLLLERTEGKFEAFLGTLLTARRHKVIQFDGEILLKGVSDDVPITLLKTEV